MMNKKRWWFVSRQSFIFQTAPRSGLSPRSKFKRPGCWKSPLHTLLYSANSGSDHIFCNQFYFHFTKQRFQQNKKKRKRTKKIPYFRMLQIDTVHRAGESIELDVDTQEAGDGQLAAVAIGPKGDAVPVEIIANRNRTFTLKLLTSRGGRWVIKFLLSY